MLHRAGTRPLRRRLLAAAVAAALALGAVPAGPGAEPALAGRPAAERPLLAAARSLGRADLRAVARREAADPPVVTPAPRRLGWPGRGAPAGNVGGGDPGATGPLAAETDAAAPAPAPKALTAAPLEPAADVGGPGVVGTAWSGLNDLAASCGTSRPCLEPPDPWVSVSATHVVQSVNPSTRVTSRTGTGAWTVTNAALFGAAAWKPASFAAHARVLYDPARDRWVATAFGGTCTGGALFVAVTATGDPAGTWQRFVVAFPGRWPDFPSLGTSSALVAVGVNEYAVSCGSGGAVRLGSFAGSSLHAFDWDDLLDGDASLTVASRPADPDLFAFVPAAGLTAGAAVHAAVAIADGSTGSTADLGYAAVSGTVAGGDLAFHGPVALGPAGVAKLRRPPTPVDAGGAIGVQANALDLRPTDAVWRDGRLAVATTVPCQRSTAVRPCARVVELVTQPDLAMPALRQDLLVPATRGYADTFMPGVGYSDDGTLWTVFSQSSSSRYVSAWARRQLPGDPPGAWSPGTAIVVPGRGPYGGVAGAGLNQRWGDQVGVARDPAEPGSVWQANQAADTGGGWYTRVARLGADATPPSVTAPRASFVAGSQAGSSSIPVRVTWSASDPGSGIAAVTLERSVNGGPYAAVTLPTVTAAEVTLSLRYGTRYQLRVTVTDNAGNTVGPVEGVPFTPIVYSEGSSRVTYAGTWTVARTTSYLGGAVRYAKVAGRRATVSFTGLAVAWVSTAARDRGSARVYLDGTRLGTYSTYRSSTVYRRVVTGRSFATAGTHTFRVEVAGTSGRPRVDLDAFVVLR